MPVDGANYSWTYTIGLAARGHPELAIAGLKFETATAVVDGLARRVLAGERFDGDDSCVIDNGDVLAVRPVDPRHFEDGLLNFWFNYYGTRPDPPPLTALQLVGPPTWFCRCHVNSQPRLDVPHPFSAPRPNREARRQSARRRRRR